MFLSLCIDCVFVCFTKSIYHCNYINNQRHNGNILLCFVIRYIIKVNFKG